MSFLKIDFQGFIRNKENIKMGEGGIYNEKM